MTIKKRLIDESLRKVLSKVRKCGQNTLSLPSQSESVASFDWNRWQVWRFLSPFGDITLWNILVSCVVLPYISPYSRMTNRILWGHILSVAPETSSMEGGPRFHLDTGHHCPDSLVTGCHRAAPRGVCRRRYHGADHPARAVDADPCPLSAVRHSSTADP